MRRWSPSPTSTPGGWTDASKVAPAAKTYLDYRHLLDDKSIDAVLIATPQHLHCEHFVAALQAASTSTRKRPWPSRWTHAKKMRAASAGRAQAHGADRPSGQLLGPERPTRVAFSARASWARSPRSTPTCTATRRTASRSGRGPILPDMVAGKHHLEVLPGRGAASVTSTPIASSTGGSSGITRAAISTRTCATSSPSGTRSWT